MRAAFSHDSLGKRRIQMSKMRCFAKIANDFQPLTIFAKHSILGV